MGKQGYIKLYRQIQECDLIWGDKPYNNGAAWVDLLLLANHEDKKTLFDKKPFLVKRGQRITSVRTLSERWGWGKDKTLRFLRMLEDEKMIIREADSRKTLITIVNYDIYQGSDLETRQSQDSHKTVTRQSPATNKNDKNDKNDNKHKYGVYENVLFTDDEYQKLINEFPDYKERIDNLSFYIKSTGKSYKDHLATIRNWARKETKTLIKPKSGFTDMQQSDYDISEIERMLTK